MKASLSPSSPSLFQKLPWDDASPWAGQLWPWRAEVMAWMRAGVGIREGRAGERTEQAKGVVPEESLRVHHIINTMVLMLPFGR